MGMGKRDVVDSLLRVHGISNLRVADSSVMPNITTGNPLAPTLVIAERAADMIIANAR
jgi:choline dehydrogenase-like flavoprotein